MNVPGATLSGDSTRPGSFAPGRKSRCGSLALRLAPLRPTRGPSGRRGHIDAARLIASVTRPMWSMLTSVATRYI